MQWWLVRSRPLLVRFISLSLATLLILVSQALAAELQLRESVLEAQRDRVTMTITAVVDHLGDRARRLARSTGESRIPRPSASRLRSMVERGSEEPDESELRRPSGALRRHLIVTNAPRPRL